MSAVFALLAFLVLLYLVLLLGRLVLDWVQLLSREWRPTGFVLVLAELVYSATDPPLRALRRVIKPVRIGQVQLDLAFLVLFLGLGILRSVLTQLSFTT
ncbi:YggT family protein [Pseudokineococcus lusitanus]|uniref:YggT family protein n=1 Tax=Pseudokineococcus lusitanus TaxID=763993 RepID=A0A3N1HKR2_9ACTN|nr:YggT family protein [Pseudokineococcus lusitanus]ROP43080.1 YggT family protein [Pseudokineococcus lusitanus]